MIIFHLFLLLLFLQWNSSGDKQSYNRRDRYVVMYFLMLLLNFVHRNICHVTAKGVGLLLHPKNLHQAPVGSNKPKIRTSCYHFVCLLWIAQILSNKIYIRCWKVPKFICCTMSHIHVKMCFKQVNKSRNSLLLLKAAPCPCPRCSFLNCCYIAPSLQIL